MFYFRSSQTLIIPRIMNLEELLSDILCTLKVHNAVYSHFHEALFCFVVHHSFTR